MQKRWKTFGLAWLLWTAVALLFTAQQYLLLLPDVTLWQAMQQPFLMWYLWGLSAPCLIWLDRHLPWRTPLARRLVSRLALGAVWTSGFIVVFLGLLIQVPLSGFVRFAPWHFLISLLILGYSIGHAYYIEARQRELEAARLAQHLSEARLQVLRAQINPHFLFNTLNTISSFIETNPRRARAIMEDLGTMLRFSLEASDRSVIPLAAEMAHLRIYTDIMQTRFEGKLTVTYTLAPDTEDALVPPFLLQPLVENAIQHGITTRTQPGQVTISVASEGDQLVLGIADDGVGLPPGWKREPHAGLGLQNTEARLRELYGDAFVFDLQPRPNGGTRVQLRLPLRRPKAAPQPEEVLA